ncbi:hypothetical protein H257_08683 [Aphanomyces astaci]|uniref:Reverse transcriptase domain-containing protein n=1 Tax=Aphanomyces astaci TaxID=112090 RepID=W4GDY0_APHAT|nr:hypothetical protein H257_08683 [Aphanomyces astaci]ETV77897.1 hypothetical protein H257_08683 [Aphanomyces astaci]|eukprot:XP_009833007.1 hypothetical protein H257_08683 [Aphanomyces astaci]
MVVSPSDRSEKDGTFRMTVDTRGPNSRIEPMHWSMLVLEVVMARLVGKSCFFAVDWFKGFWQLALHPNSKEAYAIMGVDAMVVSNRVLMGQSDAVASCTCNFPGGVRRAIQTWYRSLAGRRPRKCIDETELLDLLEWLLAKCVKFGLKPSERLSEARISHDSKGLAGLVDLPTPVTFALKLDAAVLPWQVSVAASTTGECAIGCNWLKP